MATRDDLLDGPDPAGRPVRRRYDTAQTRQRVLEAAQQLFAQQGFAATTTADIAAAADVAEGSIFYHFGTKRQLLKALGRHFGTAMVETMRAGALDLSTLTPALMVARAFDFCLQNGSLTQRVGLEAGDPAGEPVLAEARAITVRFIEDVMRATPKDHLPPDLHIPTAASLAFAAVHDAVERLHRGGLETEPAVVRAECMRFISSACGDRS